MEVFVMNQQGETLMPCRSRKARRYFSAVAKMILETGTFDRAKMKNPNITNEQYQKGVIYA
jgi:uncharacterized membrane protein YcaP (DUF421 family)